MQTDISVQKQQLRRVMRQRREALAGREMHTQALCAHLERLPSYQAALTLHTFLPMQSEPDLRPLLRQALAQGKRVAVPVVEPDGTLANSWIRSLDPAAFVTGRFGTLYPTMREPAEPGTWQITLVPLLAFDAEGYRLGYGKGYYDRLLAMSPGLHIGIAFACQQVAQVPRETHDVPVDLIVTEAGVLPLL
ncbi:5-formyltetrahydrofolate cyclo-ligase [Candidatus Chloroploca asiatica]|uniref:5-formyltetrahydrofolate cyclo-ligase n=1 Tax=Candidatus Chloroploca asiatica TaxID=1506545 RepID=A0A2H3KJ69_9CHLR|nr:5-formyltetrahydrofolate cyclo-ligase [Candidatus Chloroploca asiatica]PDV97208.1 5-formyltetrahydrofolate cyclo-ligase [Candidatus Chloroploca asiatica]